MSNEATPEVIAGATWRSVLWLVWGDRSNHKIGPTTRLDYLRGDGQTVFPKKAKVSEVPAGPNGGESAPEIGCSVGREIEVIIAGFTALVVAFPFPDFPIVANGLQHGLRGIVQPSSFLFIQMTQDRFTRGPLA
jgi:hypothetical protein